MAVDSAAKRFSMLGLGNVSVLLRVPAGSIAAAQQATLLHLYHGIALDVPAIVAGAVKMSPYPSDRAMTPSTNSKRMVISTTKRRMVVNRG